MMENRREYIVLLCLLTVLGAKAQTAQIKLVGSNVILVPKYTRDLKEITWRINNSIVVEVELNPLRNIIFKLPKDRVTINDTNGALTIRNLNIMDSGMYTSEAVLRNDTVDRTDISLSVHVPRTIDKKKGHDVTLVPHYTGDPSEMNWKVNGNKLVDMELKPPVNIVFHRLQDRATISPTNGSLKIRDVTIEDSGVYKAEVTVDNVIQETRININVSIPRTIDNKGQVVTLVPHYTGDPSAMKWTLNGNKLVDMELKPPANIVFHRLQDRATISPTNGSLIIRDLTIEDSGMYKAEVTVDNVIQETGIIINVSKPLSGWIIALIVILIISTIVAVCYFFYKRSSKGKGMIGVPGDGTEKLKSCITVKSWTPDMSLVDESQQLLEDSLNRIWSSCLTIHEVKPADREDYIVEALLSNGKTCTFTTKETNDVVIIQPDGDRVKLSMPDTEKVTQLLWKKGAVVLFEWSNSGVKFHSNNITLESGSVTVNNVKGKASYKAEFHLEESESIIGVTFHPIKMNGKTTIIWKKDDQPVNIDGDKIQMAPNGDLTIINVTSEYKGKYTALCRDKNLKEEFILH